MLQQSEEDKKEEGDFLVEDVSPKEEDDMSYVSDQTMSNIQEELEKAKKAGEEYLNGWKRAKADYANLQKEMDKRSAELLVFANAALLVDIAPLLDQFNKAFQHIPQGMEDHEWVQGIRHIYSNFMKVVQTIGAQEIPTVGAVFNPELHEAVEEVESDMPKGVVTEKVSSGYTMRGKVCVPAKVKVAK